MTCKSIASSCGFDVSPAKAEERAQAHAGGLEERVAALGQSLAVEEASAKELEGVVAERDTRLANLERSLQHERTAALQGSKLLSHDEKASNDLGEAPATAQRSKKTSRSKSKDKKVKFKEVYESRNMQAIQQERQKKDQ